MSKTGWDRKLGTSKKEQGIKTPARPERLRCGCLMRKGRIEQVCIWHTKLAEKKRKEEKRLQFLKKIKEKVLQERKEKHVK